MIRRVSGDSMRPTLVTGQLVFITHATFKKGSMVLAKVEKREVIKRVGSIKKDMVYLVGDNHFDSTDSRHYGPVHKSAILGTVMIVFPKATNPPKLVKPYGLWLGRSAAGILAIMALIHLFRIDTLVPILDELLPGGGVIARAIVVAVIFSEIFAIPFALRMKLSPLMHLLSGTLLVLAPLSWLWLSIWALDTNYQVGQLGEFVSVYATPYLLLVNLLWVSFNYFGLYTLGYNRLSIPSLLRK